MNELQAKCQEDVALSVAILPCYVELEGGHLFRSCIRLALGEIDISTGNLAGLKGAEHIDTTSKPIISNCRVDLNVSSRWVLLVESSNVHRVHRFSINDISVVYPGRDHLSELFCFIAKSPID